MAAACIADMKKVQPTGPYFLVGDCFSAPVAYETARQLRSAGDNIGALWLFDAWRGSQWLDRYLGRTLATRARHYYTPFRKMCRRLLDEHVIRHLTALRSLDGAGARSQYVLTKLGRLGHLVVRRPAKSPSGEGRLTTLATHPDSQVDAREIGRAFNAYRFAVRSYRYRPYDGVITLIASEEWSALDPSLGWRGDNRLEIHRIPGKHANAYNEQAHRIADILRASIRSAETAMGTASSLRAEKTAS
jgi:thioesterase domain-containing protein